MRYLVTEAAISAQLTAVIAESTTWDAFPRLWPNLLEEVWAGVRSSGEITPNRNVMLYRDDVPNVEIGVEVAETFAAFGRVIPSSLPAGRVATTTHRGDYAKLGLAHRAIVEWCDRHGLQTAGARWEIYGHATERTADQEVEVFYLLPD